MKQRVAICVWAVISVLSAWLSFSAEAAAPANLFFDGFDRPLLNPSWQASLPDNAFSGSFPGGSSQTAHYVGAPAYGFQTLGTNTVLRLTNSLNPLTRCGWSTTNHFNSTNFVYEVRFNTLNQSATTSIDGFIEIWLIDATDSSRYDIVSPFGGSYDGSLSFFAGSSIDTNFTETPFSYATNTWYRLRLSGFPGQNIRASFCDDTGVELTGMTFNHGAAAFSHGFKLGLSQLVGAAGGIYSEDVAVDYVKLGGVPPAIESQPVSLVVTQGASATFSVSATGSPSLSYHWRFNGAAIAGATGPSLSLANIQAARAGNYSVIVTNVYGSVTSSIVSLAVVLPPVITLQPTNQIVTNGVNVKFNLAGGGGSGILSYQWLLNGLPIGPSNVITTVAGNNSVVGSYSGDGGPATNAGMNNVAGIAMDGTGDLYIADSRNNVIRKVDSAGVMTTVAGNSSLGASYTGDGGPATNAGLFYPNSVALDRAGNLFIADFGNSVIRKVDTNGIITTVAGNNSLSGGSYFGNGSYSGDGGPATNAALNNPAGVAVDSAGNLYIADYHNNVIRKVDINGIITTVAGKQGQGGVYSGDGGAATNAAFDAPAFVAVDGSGNLYIADTGNNFVRKVDPNGLITTVAGGQMSLPITPITQPINPPFWGGGDGSVIITESSRFPGGDYFGGTQTGLPSVPSSPHSDDGIPTSNVYLNGPNGLVIDGTGNLYIADTGNNVIRKVATNGLVTTLAGNQGLGAGYSGDGGAATNASLDAPIGLALDALGNVYVGDGPNGVVRKVTTVVGVNPASGALSLTGAPGGLTGNYQVVANYAGGSVTSSIVKLVVLSPTVITTQPSSLTVLQGSTITLNVGAYGTPPLTYQWSFNGAKLAGATSASLTLANVHAAQAGNYTVQITSPAGSVTSSIATLAVITPPVIKVQPVSETVAVGGSVSLGVTATGLELTYQWLYDGVPLLGSNIITTVAGNASLSGGYSGDGGPATNAALNYAGGIARDGAGNLYIGDSFNNVVRKVDPQGVITTFAGNNSLPANYTGNGGPATNATLSLPSRMAVDGAGNVYIDDLDNNAIRKVDANGVITTVAGGPGLYGYSGDGGPAAKATLNFPLGIAVDGAGDLYIVDCHNGVVREVAANGIITTVAGGGRFGDGGAATNASLNVPQDVALDGAGNFYISEAGNNDIRKVDASGRITTVAGSASLGAGYSGDGGSATNATLSNPNGIAVDRSGNLYIADYYNNVIRKVDASGIITTVAGNNSIGGNYSGDGGSPTNAALNNPVGVSVDATGDLFIADGHNSVIREVLQTGISINPTNGALSLTNLQFGMSGNYQVTVSNPAGSVTSSVATLKVLSPPVITNQSPSGITVVGDSVTLFASAYGTAPLEYQWNFNGSKITGATGTTLSLNKIQLSQAGNYQLIVTNAYGSTTSSIVNLAVVLPTVATLQPTNQTVTNGVNVTFNLSGGSGGVLSYQWLFNGAPIWPSDVITTVAGNNSLGGSYSGDGGRATSAGMAYVAGIARDAAGDLYIADSHNHVIRKVDASGIITTVAGNNSIGGSYSGDGGPATNAALYYPNSVALDGAGNLYIADFGNSVVRKVDAHGIITTVAGNNSLSGGYYSGNGSYSGDGGAATNAALNNPAGIGLDSAGNLYIADFENNVVRKVDTNGIITTVAGSHGLGGGYSGDGGPATNAALAQPAGVAVDAGGNLYLADEVNNVIRKVDTNGIITTVVGNHGLGGTYSGDGGPATNAALYAPNDIAFDSAGNLYFADSYNNAVREVGVDGIITKLAGNPGLGAGYSGDGGPATNATLNAPIGVAVDSLGNVYIGDGPNSVVRKVTTFAAVNPANSSLSLTGVTGAMTGNYQVVATYAAGSVTSSVVKLVVLSPTVITTQPAGQTVVEGGGISLNVSAYGTPPLTYQWSFNGAKLAGASSATLTLTNIHPGQAGNYAVKITTPAGTVTSANALVTVLTQTMLVYNFTGTANYFAGSQSSAYGLSGLLVYLPGGTNGTYVSWATINGKKTWWTGDFTGNTLYTIAGAGRQTATVLGAASQGVDGLGNPAFSSSTYTGINTQLNLGHGQGYSFPAALSGTVTDVYTDPDSGALIEYQSNSIYTFATQPTQNAIIYGQTVADLINGTISSLQSQGYRN